MGNHELIKIAGWYNRYGPPRKLMQEVDLWTLAAGPARGTSILFEKRNTQIADIWQRDKERTQEILARKPVILVCNHPNALEPLMFLSKMPSKENTSIIGASPTKTLFGKEFGRHIIPVSKPRIWERQAERIARQQENMKGIDRAIDRLRGGDSILIAPDGGVGTNEWKKGAVRLVEGALELDEAYLVMGYVPDSAQSDHWKVILKRTLQRQVHISEAVNVQDLPIPDALRAMPTGARGKLFGFSKILTSYYKNWIEGIF